MLKLFLSLLLQFLIPYSNRIHSPPLSQMETALDLALITMIHVYIQKYMQKILSRSKKI